MPSVATAAALPRPLISPITFTSAWTRCTYCISPGVSVSEGPTVGSDMIACSVQSADGFGGGGGGGGAGGGGLPACAHGPLIAFSVRSRSIETPPIMTPFWYWYSRACGDSFPADQ